ncbi:acetolactate synthase small subunit [Marinigracilibium pacificum]|uniref:Acetolactate synthase small subunit n=1 Tax=Marinigracilibium pacificum TaxID=2729599 RepID=A0A848IUL8_9BACT|nr:acetolactate synthase small subunit [Marinigracilibium pacificum]NMM47396.1 acetolactate synthase small subunit [Marinigracilibium pacificum]
MNTEETREFTLSILTENKSGLLNRITIIFTRRKINIEAINVSETEVHGVSRFTIVVKSTREKLEKVTKQIKKIIEVLGAFLYDDSEIHYQEIALYKLPTKMITSSNHIENLVRSSGARVLTVGEEYTIIEKTGHSHEILNLFDQLKPFGVQEFVKSGRIAISKSKRQTVSFLEELEALSLVS